VLANGAQIIFEDGSAARITLGSDTLEDDCSRDGGIDLQESLDLFFERVELTWPMYGGAFGIRVMEVFTHGFRAEMKGAGDLFFGETFVTEPVYFKDNMSIYHGALSGIG
jgi:hypothetical protein